MKKNPVPVTIQELEEILDKYLQAGTSMNYALKIVGHPGVGKSAIVKEAAQKMNFHFIDTRLAFKENIDLGGYPVPDHSAKRMIYYRPRFIPPEEVPEQNNGIVWFLDEANRAHPTVIQTLFQIITEGRCGEHDLPEKTFVVLAGNLGEEDNTTITEFDDSALDGRLAIFHLKPATNDWLDWANRSGIHPAVIRYITLFPEKLWDEININPNPRGWHQVSEALTESYKLETEKELVDYLGDNRGGTLEKLILSLVGEIAGSDFIMQLTAPRELTTREILSGNQNKLKRMMKGTIPSEDLLWAISGALDHLKEKNSILKNRLGPDDLRELGNVLQFIGNSRADTRISFFFLLLKECGLLTAVPSALKTIDDDSMGAELMKKFGDFF
ncbi:MAG: hypothetical protein GY754_39825 [bacterium]|nr:hypothetical protein [bacterium]